MKKIISMCLLMVMSVLFFSGCNKSLNVDENTVYINKKGKVIGAVIENFDKDYYNAEELEQFIHSRVEEYTLKNGEESVEIQDFSVESGIARLNMVYDGYSHYAGFNEIQMFVGSIPQAMAEGYDFSGEFRKVEDGELKSEVDKSEVTSNFEYKVVILSEKVNVKVDGTILYVSSDYTSLVEEDTVRIKLPEGSMDGEEQKLTYIIYE